MDNKKKLIIFAEDWGRFPSSSQHLINALLKLGWDIIWINSIGLRKPEFNWSYVKRAFEKLYQSLFGSLKQAKSALPSHLTVINPLIIPFIGYSMIDRINCFILKRQLKKVRQKRNFIQPIIWTTLPTAYPFTTIFANCPLVYYCCDDYELLVDKPYPQLLTLENKLINKADLILVVSEVLATKMPASKTYYLDHGIDLAVCMQNYPPPLDLPEGKPIAGFYGSITHWVDIDLIYECASQLKDWNFVFIGPKSVDIKKLEALENFFYLGPKPYTEIPAYSQYWDVGLIPFIKNKLIYASNPLKVKEYFCGGKPIVSVHIPALTVYQDCLYLAKDNKDFIRGIQLSLKDKKGDIRKSRALQEGWDSRAKVLDGTLLALLP